MPKVRKPVDNMTQRAEEQVDIEDVAKPSAEAIEAFASQADKTRAELKAETLDPTAPHNYKSVNVPMNEYIFTRLDSACKKEQRSKKEFIRMAIEKAVKEGL